MSPAATQDEAGGAVVLEGGRGPTHRPEPVPQDHFTGARAGCLDTQRCTSQTSLEPESFSATMSRPGPADWPRQNIWPSLCWAQQLSETAASRLMFTI